MGYGAEQHEDVPYRVESPLVVVGEEVCASAVHQPLCEQQDYHGGGKSADDLRGYQYGTPAHDEVDGEREAGVLAKCYNLVDRTSYDGSPLQREHQPACPASYDAYA